MITTSITRCRPPTTTVLISLDVAILSIIDRDTIEIRLLTHIRSCRFMDMQDINDFGIVGVSIRSSSRHRSGWMLLVFLQDPEQVRGGRIGPRLLDAIEGWWTSIVLLRCSSSIGSIALVRRRRRMTSQGTQTFGGSPLLLLDIVLLLLWCRDGCRPQQPP